jgi:nucleotide-binding universal stress UspA family protein
MPALPAARSVTANRGEESGIHHGYRPHSSPGGIVNSNYLIIVGVDGSEGGRRALDWAAGEAARRGGAVQAVIAWSWDGVELGPVIATSAHEAADHARRVLQQEIEALARRRGSSVPVAAEVVKGRPADVLAEAGKAGNLLVLGSHGHSRVRHTVLGSVSEECIRKATCPVAVIPVPVSESRMTAEPVPHT